MVIDNQIPKTKTVYEIKNEFPSFEEFMENYEVDEQVNYDDLNSWDIGTQKGYEPMTLYHDIAPFEADFSSRANDWSYRSLFQYSDGTIKNKLSLEGTDEMKQALREIENGTIKVVRNDRNDSLRYVPAKNNEEELKKELRKMIKSLENDYSHYNGEMMFVKTVSSCYRQV